MKWYTDNTWILKPSTLARSLNISITQELPCIARHREFGSTLISKYIHSPLLFKGKKFDMRWTIFVESVGSKDCWFLSLLCWLTPLTSVRSLGCLCCQNQISQSFFEGLFSGQFWGFWKTFHCHGIQQPRIWLSRISGRVFGGYLILFLRGGPCLTRSCPLLGIPKSSPHGEMGASRKRCPSVYQEDLWGSSISVRDERRENEGNLRGGSDAAGRLDPHDIGGDLLPWPSNTPSRGSFHYQSGFRLPLFGREERCCAPLIPFSCLFCLPSMACLFFIKFSKKKKRKKAGLPANQNWAAGLFFPPFVWAFPGKEESSKHRDQGK